MKSFQEWLEHNKPKLEPLEVIKGPTEDGTEVRIYKNAEKFNVLMFDLDSDEEIGNKLGFSSIDKAKEAANKMLGVK